MIKFELKDTQQSTRLYLVGLIVLWGLYVLFSIFAPTDLATSRYAISKGSLSIIKITIAIPYLLIWLATAYSVIRFHRYTNLLDNAAENKGFKKMTNAFIALLFVGIIPPFLSLFNSYYPYSEQIRKTETILSNFYICWFSSNFTGLLEIYLLRLT
jgi:hypothetical protein